MQKRYLNRELTYYTTEYLVECPKCHKSGTVYKNEEEPKYPHNMVFACGSCMYKTKLSEQIMYKAKVERNCPNCGKPIASYQHNLRMPPRDMQVQCPNCKFVAEYQANVSSYLLSPDLKGQKGDPHFCFALWLQTEVRGNLFWAYNRKHLETIRLYVDAQLRENKTGYLMTMVNRLPSFIKSAKNRAAILKAIEHMRCRM